MKEKDQSFFVTELAVGPSRPVQSVRPVPFFRPVVPVRTGEGGEWRVEV